MIRALVLLLAILSGGAAAAQGRGSYDVTGVAPDDALFIRARPSNEGEVVGVLQHDETGVRVTELSDNGRWGRVDHEGAEGWVYLGYMKAQGGATGFPGPLDCTGTEPFWSLAIRPDSVTLDEASGSGFDGTAGTRTRAAGRGNRWSLRAFDSGRSLTAIIVGEECSDGMSDRTYPYTVDVLLSEEDDHGHISGCCSRP
ncbi:COG3650 family protein [Palleronia sp.]|uniref:COG3650 family protein n=1 Tax=Palleronia sp. TaxID=1940284 RepID=UPI0035C82C9B